MEQNKKNAKDKMKLTVVFILSFIGLNIIVMIFTISPFYTTYAETTPKIDYDKLNIQNDTIENVSRFVRTKTIYEINDFHKKFVMILCGLCSFNAVLVITGVIRFYIVRKNQKIQFNK
ncbi:MAG: hypothetical protein GX660_00050 [Clostridiaceae bacterium]|nr:hypothetical protein [Clostridiaceae bacterium]